MPISTARHTSEVEFETLYRSSRDDVYAYVATLLRDSELAEDVTAIAFERAYRKRRSFAPGAAVRAHGCLASRATRLWTSYAVESDQRRSSRRSPPQTKSQSTSAPSSSFAGWLCARRLLA